MIKNQNLWIKDDPLASKYLMALCQHGSWCHFDNLYFKLKNINVVFK